MIVVKAEKKPKNFAEKTIQERLENWGRCQRGVAGGGMRVKETRSTSPYGGQGYKCMTAVVCSIMAAAATGEAGWRAANRSTLDFTDSDLITKAWQKMPEKPRTLLKLAYALKTQEHVMCRQLNIRHWPASHLRRAKDEAENILQGIIDNR